MNGTFSEQFSGILNIIKSISLIDVIDILVVAVLLYYLFVFVRNRRAGKLAVGIILLIIVRAISTAFEMNLLGFILQNIFQIGFITLVILFQPEIRAMLEKFGTTPLKSLKTLGETKEQIEAEEAIDEVVSAVCDFSASKTGALIVFERQSKLGDIIATGTVVDAKPSSNLIKNIFFNKAPMHDGAVVIRDMRVHAAGCVLPLSSNLDKAKNLGTRHRSGLGMSENSDAVVVIVSEESGKISTAIDGELVRGYNRDTLTQVLRSNLIGSGEGRRVFGIFSKKDKNNGEDGK